MTGSGPFEERHADLEPPLLFFDGTSGSIPVVVADDPSNRPTSVVQSSGKIRPSDREAHTDPLRHANSRAVEIELGPG